MQERLDIQIYSHEGKILMLGTSYTSQYQVIPEFPYEEVPHDAPADVIGEALMAAAARCRGIVDEPPTQAEDKAHRLGFKSWSQLQKKTHQISVSRRKSEPYFSILPTRWGNKSGSQILFTGEELTAPIGDTAAIGLQILEALRLTAENRLSG